MPSIINATTTNGLSTSADNSGSLQLATNNGTTAVTIDTSQNVGIGTASPNALLTIAGASTDTRIRLVGRSADGTSAIRYYSSDNATQYGFLSFGNAYAEFNYAGSGYMGFATNNTERMRIPATGGLQVVNSISVGNATPTTSGAGITFPATQSASTDANTLDDYEEGTWTPTITRNSSNPTITYGTQLGVYVKIGRIVYVSCNVSWSANTGGSGVNWFISGLPFTNTNGGANYAQATIQDFNGITFSASRTQFGGYVNSNETRLFLCSGGSNQSTDNITVGSSGYMYMSGVYIASA